MKTPGSGGRWKVKIGAKVLRPCEAGHFQAKDCIGPFNPMDPRQPSTEPGTGCSLNPRWPATSWFAWMAWVTCPAPVGLFWLKTRVPCGRWVSCSASFLGWQKPSLICLEPRHDLCLDRKREREREISRKMRHVQIQHTSITSRSNLLGPYRTK